jgi:hypothetical protein
MPDREALGRRVREVFAATAEELLDNPKPSWTAPWEEIDGFQREVDMRIGEALAEPYEDLLSSLWLYINWRWITKQLTTEQKDLFADAIDAEHARANEDDPNLGALPVERWWRDA